jgi:hypothetical protein
MGRLSKIKAKLAAILAQLSVVKTDNGILHYDGEELVAGMNVFIEDENGERKAAEDGEYVTEDNKTITVKDGVVESIVDPVAEVDGAEEEPTEEPKEEEEPIEEEPKKEELEEEPTVEEEPAKETEEDAIAEIRKEINELYKLVDSILDKIGETRKEADERLSKIEKMSAAQPAEKALEDAVSRSINLTGDAKIDKQLKRAMEMNRDWRK